jgi:hypothetical protein
VLPGDAALDESCLGLCIALLDHDLRGDLFESVIVGYLAVLGIDDARGTLREACQYTPLSGLIKIAQMLTEQVDAGDQEDPFRLASFSVVSS